MENKERANVYKKIGKLTIAGQRVTLGRYGVGIRYLVPIGVIAEWRDTTWDQSGDEGTLTGPASIRITAYGDALCAAWIYITPGCSVSPETWVQDRGRWRRATIVGRRKTRVWIAWRSPRDQEIRLRLLNLERLRTLPEGDVASGPSLEYGAALAALQRYLSS
jgi:hypothetical protein